MASKALLVLCVLLAIALLVSSREVAEKHDEKKAELPPSYGHVSYPGHGSCPYPCGGGGKPDGRGGYNRGGHGGGGNPNGGHLVHGR